MRLNRCLALLAVVICASSSFAAKVEKLPLVSDAHLGFVTGIGTGINFGFDAGFDLLAVELGAELEQVITDVDYTAGINATRFGGFLNFDVSDGILANVHMGVFEFQVKNRDIAYNSNGTNYLLLAGTQRYTGKYQAISLDIPWQEFMVSPKFVVNSIDGQGSFSEFNLNLGRSF